MGLYYYWAEAKLRVYLIGQFLPLEDMAPNSNQFKPKYTTSSLAMPMMMMAIAITVEVAKVASEKSVTLPTMAHLSGKNKVC